MVVTEPWHFTRTYQRRREWTIREYVCSQNNRDKFDDQGPGILDLTPQDDTRDDDGDGSGGFDGDERDND